MAPSTDAELIRFPEYAYMTLWEYAVVVVETRKTHAKQAQRKFYLCCPRYLEPVPAEK